MLSRLILVVLLAPCVAEPSLDEDSECVANSDCALHALQRRAAAKEKTEDSKNQNYIPGIGDTPGLPDFDIPGIGDLPSEDDVMNTPEEEPEDEESEDDHEDQEDHEDDHGHESIEEEPEDEETNEPYTGPTMPPLPPNPPTPIPPSFKAVNPIIVRGNFLYDSVTGAANGRWQ
eukprot:s952_g16.t1